eukprot:5796214-Ditylum_brightwellii.AAC.1
MTLPFLGECTSQLLHQQLGFSAECPINCHHKWGEVLTLLLRLQITMLPQSCASSSWLGGTGTRRTICFRAYLCKLIPEFIVPCNNQSSCCALKSMYQGNIFAAAIAMLGKDSIIAEAWQYIEPLYTFLGTLNCAHHVW